MRRLVEVLALSRLEIADVAHLDEVYPAAPRELVEDRIDVVCGLLRDRPAAERDAVRGGIDRTAEPVEVVAITDMSAYSKFMDASDGLLAGTDLWDSMIFNKVRGPELKKYAEDPAIVSAMREASHRILYSVVNSNALNGIAPDAKVGSSIPWYYKIVYGVAAVFVLLSALNIRRLVKGVKMKKAARLEAAPAASNDSSVDGPAKK